MWISWKIILGWQCCSILRNFRLRRAVLFVDRNILSWDSYLGLNLVLSWTIDWPLLHFYCTSARVTLFKFLLSIYWRIPKLSTSHSFQLKLLAFYEWNETRGFLGCSLKLSSVWFLVLEVSILVFAKMHAGCPRGEAHTCWINFIQQVWIYKCIYIVLPLFTFRWCFRIWHNKKIYNTSRHDSTLGIHGGSICNLIMYILFFCEWIMYILVKLNLGIKELSLKKMPSNCNMSYILEREKKPKRPLFPNGESALWLAHTLKWSEVMAWGPKLYSNCPMYK